MTAILRTRFPAMVALFFGKHHAVLSLLLLVSFLSPLLWLSQYDYPAGDDYLAFFQAQNLGPLAATRWWYRYWTGRYSSFFLQSLFPEHSVWLAAYQIIPIILLLAGFLSLLCFVRALFGPDLPTKHLFALSASAYVFLVSLTPEISTAYYWLPTNVQYLGAVFVTLFLLALYINLGRPCTPIRRGLYWLAAVLLIAFLGGLNEISILLFVAIVAFVNAFHALRFARLTPTGLVFLLGSVLFALVSFLAPGNSIRAEYVVFKEVSRITVLASAARFTLYLLVKLLTATPLLLVSALYFVFLERHRDGLAGLFAMLAKVRWHWLLLLLYVTFTLVTVGLFAAAGVHTVPDRVRNVYVYSLALSWFLVVTVLFVEVTSAGLRLPTQHAAIHFLGLAGGAVVMLYLATGFHVTVYPTNGDPAANRVRRLASSIKTGSVYANAYLDIVSGRAAGYAAQTAERTRRFMAANGECVVFPSLSRAPETIAVQFVKYPWRWCPREYLRRFEAKHGGK